MTTDLQYTVLLLHTYIIAPFLADPPTKMVETPGLLSLDGNSPIMEKWAQRLGEVDVEAGLNLEWWSFVSVVMSCFN